jgi:PAS domain S-box-containing protein
MRLLNHTWVKHAHLLQMKDELTSKKTQMSAALEFVKAITQGNLEVGFNSVIENDAENELSASLVNMRDQMKKISTEEKQRNWVTEGLAKFGEILRHKSDNLKGLSELIISSLVKYLNANQGALYLINEEKSSDIFIELAACYAYGRKKHIEQRIELGQGLIGQVALEKSTLYMTNIPNDYLKITSGLGEALPRNLLIVPLKLEDKIFGLVEVASFQLIVSHEIEFIERLGVSIASTIAAARTSERTKQLLQETQSQAEEMRSQEEEMRQNMEELTATQEEMQRILKEVQSQERYMNELIDSSVDSILVMDKSYKVLSANKTVRQTYAQLGIDIVKGLDVAKLFDPKEWLRYKAFYDRTFAGESFQHTERFESHGFKSFFLNQHTPIRDKEGNIVASAVFAKDVTELVKAQQTAEELALDQQQKNEELKAQEEELRQNMEELSATQDEMQRIIHEVQKKEKYLNDVINVSNDIIFTIDQSYKVISFNKAMEAGMAKLGIALEKGFCMLDIFQGKEIEVQRSYYDRALEGESYERTEHFTHGDIDVYTIVSYAPLTNDDDEIYAVACFSKDVTEVHHTLKQVEKKERELNEIINASTDPIWTVDANYKLMAFNKNFIHVFAARNVTVAKGMDMIEVLQEQEREAQIEIYARVFSGETFELTQTFVFQGEESHILISYSPIRDESEKITGATVYAKNISAMVNAKKHAEKLVQETQAQNEALKEGKEEIENIQQKLKNLETREYAYLQTTLFVELDVHGKIVDLNEKLLKVAGYQREDLIGKSYLSLTDLPRQLFMACSKDLVAGKLWKGILRNITQTGSHFWADVTIVPIKDHVGKIAKILISGYPITSRLGADLFLEQARELGWPAAMIATKSIGKKRSLNGNDGTLPLSSKVG